MRGGMTKVCGACGASNLDVNDRCAACGSKLGVAASRPASAVEAPPAAPPPPSPPPPPPAWRAPPPYAPPGPFPPRLAWPGGPRRAEIGVRFLAWVVDVVILLVVTGLLLFPFAAFPRNPLLLLDPAFVGLGAALTLGYYGYFEGTQGRSLGKKAFNLRVLRTDGRPIGIEQALLRNVAKVFFLLLLLDVLLWLVAFREERQRASDRIAETIVVDERAGSWQSAPQGS